MSTYLISCRQFKVRMILLIISFLIVIPISGVYSASSKDENQNEHQHENGKGHGNELIHIKEHNIIHLSGGGMAYEKQILAFGTQCGKVRGFRELNKGDLSWITPGMTWHSYKLTGKQEVEKSVEQINQAGYNCIASPNYLNYSMGSSSWGSPHTGYGANADINDINSQLPAIMSNALRGMTTPPLTLMSNHTGSGVTVAMFDTYCHEKSQNHLQQNGFENIQFFDGNNGNYITHPPATSGLPVKLCGHGEAVISMLRSIAPQTNVRVYRVLDDQAFGSLEGLIAALNDFAQGGIPTKSIINLSLGVKADEGDDVPILREVLEWLDQLNVLIVAAAGNEERRAPTQYPAAYDFVIGVAASDHQGNQASYANDGDVLAAGGDGDCGESNTDAIEENRKCLAILNSESPKGASYWKGSSFSAGIISGVAALLWEQNPTQNASDIKTQLVP